MKKLFRSNGSSMLLAAVLVAAISLVGTAVAGRDSTSAGLSRAELKQVVRKQIWALAPRLTVARARRANKAETAQNAETAQSAAVAQRSEKADIATRANVASSARNADTVNGIKMAPVRYEQNPGSGSTAIYSEGGFTLKASCAPNGELSIVASTTLEDSSIYASAVDTNSNDNNSNANEAGGSFDAGDEFDLLAGSSGDPALITFGFESPNGSDPLVGTVTTDEHNPAGSVCRVRGIISNGYAAHYDGN